MRFHISLLFFGILAINACKSTKKLFDKGQYDKALYSALDDIKKKPGNTSAASILPQAYNEAAAKYENAIAGAKSGTTTAEKLDIIYKDYRALQKMYDAIAATPAAFGHVTARNYTSELSAAAEDAALFRYNAGMDMLQRGDRISAQKAFENFKLTASYLPGYKDVEDRKAAAYDLAVANVVVDKFDQRFGGMNVNGDYFQNDIVRTLNNIGNSHYYQFYAINEPRARQVRVDQYMDINVYDIWFGQLASNSYSYSVSKEITEKDDRDPKLTRKLTVTASVSVTRRVKDCRAIMDYRITDAASRRMIANDRIPAQYTWEKLTGNYTGDSRALGDKDWAIVRGTYNNQPGYDELYRQLTNQLMNQFNNRMRNIYAR
jgi:hypothetical protein